jgi:hypothetical protein
MKTLLLGCALSLLCTEPVYAQYIDLTQGGLDLAHGKCKIASKKYYCYIVKKDSMFYLLSQDDCGEYQIWRTEKLPDDGKLATKDMELIWTRERCSSKWDLWDRGRD